MPSTTLPTLFWWSSPGHLTPESAGGQLTVELTDTLGTWHELASVTEASGAGFAWADLSPWAGQPVTLTFRFDPRGDATAWAWLDDVHLGGVPANVGVMLGRPAARLNAGDSFAFDATAINRRPLSLTAPLEVTWPANWTFVEASAAAVEMRAGLARFDVPLAGGVTAAVRVTLTLPANTAPSIAAITARLLPLFAAEDYTPSDNAAELAVPIGCQPYWLPLLMR